MLRVPRLNKFLILSLALVCWDTKTKRIFDIPLAFDTPRQFSMHPVFELS